MVIQQYNNSNNANKHNNNEHNNNNNCQVHVHANYEFSFQVNIWKRMLSTCILRLQSYSGHVLPTFG